LVFSSMTIFDSNTKYLVVNYCIIIILPAKFQR
jgi:hypothetical protein